MEIMPGFTGATLDRADALRMDEARLAQARLDPRARLLGLNGLDPLLDAAGGLSWQSMEEAAAGSELVFLGLDGSEPRFAALDYARAESANRSMAVMQLIARLPAAEAALYGGARSVVDWHCRHRFCARCGAATALFRAGWGRKCAQCGSEHFPRVDPVVIMLAEFGGRVLLGRQPMFPPKFYSALAGFVEPGESLEEAVRRELFEEAGVRTGAVRYVVSQPWPFPSSLMIGCIAQAEADAITLDTNELQHAMWVDRDAVEAALAGDAAAPFMAPPRIALAHSLLRAWLG